MLLADLVSMGRKLRRLLITGITCDSFLLPCYFPPYRTLNHGTRGRGLVQGCG